MNVPAFGAMLVCLFNCVARGADPLVVPEQLKDVPASNFCKVVDGTTSKDGSTAVAVGFLRPEPVDWSKFRREGGDYLLGGEEEDAEVADFVVDLKKDRVLAVLRGKHPGTLSTYNHERYQVAWSEGGKYLVETQSWKWHTAAATLYLFDDKGTVAAVMDLLPVAKEQLRIVSERDHKITRQKFEESYSVSLWENAVDATGRVTLDALAEVPKSEEAPAVSLLIRFTARTDDKGKLSAGELEVKAKVGK
jgi:hypothetical protein